MLNHRPLEFILNTKASRLIFADNYDSMGDRIVIIFKDIHANNFSGKDI